MSGTETVPVGARPLAVTRLLALGKSVSAGVLALLVLSLLTFVATNFRSPREQAIAALGHEATPEQLAEYIAVNNLDQSAVARYGEWLSGIVGSGSFGSSASTGEPITAQLLPRLQNTVSLATLSMLLAVAVAIPLGIYMAHRADTVRGLVLNTVAVVVASVPEFVLGVGLILLFAVQLEWLPVDSSGVTLGTGAEQARSFVLPVVTLALAVIPYVSRICRAGVQEAQESMAVRAATLRGISARRVEIGHSLRLAAIPLINAVAISAVSLLGGVLVIENVFGFPGLGQLAVSSLETGDTGTLQACAVTLGALVVLINVLADVLSLRFNPRLRG